MWAPFNGHAWDHESTDKPRVSSSSRAAAVAVTFMRWRRSRCPALSALPALPPSDRHGLSSELVTINPAARRL